MKTSIYYFTGTGNSLAVSKDLAKELDNGIDIIEILPISNFNNQELIIVDADIVGIVFPVYCHDLPRIVEVFSAKLEIKSSYIFGIATYNKEPGNALYNLNRLLKKRGMSLSSGFHISMPGNNVLVIDFTTTDEENEKRFTEELKKIKTISEIVKSKKCVGIEGNYDPDEKYEIKSYLIDIYNVANQFWITEECNFCGICVKICPNKNIKMADDEIIWDKNCEYCLACLHWCPQKAIQNGDNSQKCRRYHHPNILLKEIIT